MATLRKKELLEIAGAARDFSISILMPTHRPGAEIRQDPIRLKNLLDEAENRLTRRGMRRTEADSLLAQALELIDSAEFWQQRGAGLALYLAKGFMRAIDLPYQPEERLTVGSSFRIRPLLSLLDGGERFTVVAISLAGARVFAGDRQGLVERRKLDLPQGVKEVVAETDYQQMSNAAPATPAAGHGALHGKHGFGQSPDELRKVELIEYLRRLDAALLLHLSGRSEPIVIAGDPQVSGHFHRMSKLSNLHDEVVAVNAEAFDAAALHERILPQVQPLFGRAKQAAVDHLRALHGKEDARALAAVPEIVRAAHYARIDTLFLPETGEVWGRFDDVDGQVTVHAAPDGGDIDLLDQAAVDTMRNGGAVFTLSREDLPLGAQAAAILRY
ncbi:MAG TPA: hypothetical protein VED46_18355 [Alphaproteobacteria bacterium]|nr:hypothetical protein [Alphaproteobacteria bacterium]